MKYKEFEQAVDSMQLCTKVSHFELKKRYRELSKVYHPELNTSQL
jgi:DnaJ-class molecular chaperone